MKYGRYILILLPSIVAATLLLSGCVNRSEVYVGQVRFPKQELLTMVSKVGNAFPLSPALTAALGVDQDIPQLRQMSILTDGVYHGVIPLAEDELLIAYYDDETGSTVARLDSRSKLIKAVRKEPEKAPVPVAKAAAEAFMDREFLYWASFVKEHWKDEKYLQLNRL